MTRQLTLDLLAEAGPTLDNFVPGRNAECLALLRGIASGERTRRFVHLWGAPGSGRSHLLRALAASGRLLGPDSPLAGFAFAPVTGHPPGAGCALYALDDVDRLDADRQQALFHLCNQVRSDPGCALVTAAGCAPIGLAMREDLRTRLGWGLVMEVHLLSDDEKGDALRRVAYERGVSLAPDVVPWMLTHCSRDMRVLIGQFDAIDRYAFERKRPITLPLLREWMQRAFDPPFDGPDAD